MQPQTLAQRIKSSHPPVVIDVRSGMEFTSGHIPGALHLPLWKILLRRGALPRDKSTDLVVTCEHGPRAQLALGLLQMFGYKNIKLLIGHMSSWRQAQRPVQK